MGARKYLYDKANEADEIGIVRGLAWTPVGGETMPIEVNIMSGDGQLELTGQLGDVMKESVRIARSYIRSMAKEYGMKRTFTRPMIFISMCLREQYLRTASAGITLEQL